MSNKHPKPINNNKNLCKYCGRNEELRFGGCFDCADMESMFFDRTDMYDNDYTDWTKGELLAYIIRKSMSYKRRTNNEQLIELLKTMQENSKNNQRLIELLGQRIDQIWKFLEVAGIAEPVERDK